MRLAANSQRLADMNVPEYWRAEQSGQLSKHRREKARMDRQKLLVGWICLLGIMAMMAYGMVGSL